MDRNTLLSRLASQVEDTKIGDTGYHFIDGDTIQDSDGRAIRIDGINTPEVAHERDIYSDENYRGSAAGEQASKELARLAKERGFTEIVTDGKKGVYGRDIGDLRNPETGELFSIFAAKNGLADINPYSSEKHVAAYQAGLAERTLGKQDAETTLARERIKQANFEEMDSRGLTDPFKRNALNEREYAQNPYDYSGVQIRNPDRTLMNEAKDQWSTSFDTALIGMKDAFHGFRQILGEVTGDESMVRAGEEGSASARFEMRLNPTTTVDMDDVDGIGDFVDYLANNFAMSVPYMATTIASTVAGGAVGTMAAGPLGTVGGAITGLGVGLSAPMAIYAGQVYNEQENKNTNAALISGFGQAVFDRLGIEGVLGSSIKGTLKEAAEVLVKQGMTKEAAKKKVKEVSRKELAKYMDDAADFAKRQITARNFTREVAGRFAKSFGAEAATEAMQEAMAYAGAHWDDEYFGIVQEGAISEALLERMQNAAIAGGLVGGTIGGAGGVANRVGWMDTAHTYGEANTQNADRWAEEAVRRNEGTHEDFLGSLYELPEDHKTDLVFRTDNHNTALRGRGIIDKTMDGIFSVPRLWRGHVRASITEEVLKKSPTARRVAGIYGGLLNKIHGGKNFEEAKHFNKQRYIAMAGNPRELAREYKGHKNYVRAEEEFSKDFYRIAKDKIAFDETQRAVPPNQRKQFDWSPYSKEEKEKFMPVFRKLNETSDRMLREQNRSWMSGTLKPKPKFKKIDNYLLRFKAINKEVLDDNRAEFIDKMKTIYGMPYDAANQLATDIIEGKLEDPSSDTQAIFDIMHKGFHPSASKARTIGMSEEPELQKFFNQSLAKNLDESFKSAARFEAYHDYVGKDKWKLNKMLNQMQKEGVDPATVDQIAYDIERYFQAESGNYKRPKKGTLGDRLLVAQKNLLTYSLLTSLTGSALSSTVELAMTTRGLSKEQIFGKNGLNGMGYELAKMFWRGGRRYAYESWSGDTRLDESKVGLLLDNLGYNAQETGAATTTGATETNERAQWMIDKFFKYNGLQGITNATRAIRAAMANDFMMGHMETLRDAKLKDKEAHRFAAEQLRDLGLDVVRLQKLVDKESDAIAQFGLDYNTQKAMRLTKKEQDFLSEQVQLGTFNFINDAVALPGTANRPLIYQDPRFALFTQFNGYISTVTANHLPKMWNEYIRRGSPAMKFNTFSMMATMILLGFASQYLKDLIKYGKEGNPYLSDAQEIRRAINSSGLLGTGERALNLAFPMYGNKEGQSTAAWAADTVVGEMPAMTPVSRIWKASREAYNGDMVEAKYQLARATPIIGPMNGLAEFLSGKSSN